MGDLSAEPSMEDILSSIKRIIAEEGDQPTRRARPARSTPAVPLPPHGEQEDEVLELSDPMPAPRHPPIEPATAMPLETDRPAESLRTPEPPRSSESPKPADPPVRSEPIVSTEAVAASRGALDTLSRLLVKPEPGHDGTLEGLVREMLRPMLREWLDTNLPDMVETMVAREIARIAGQTQ